MSEHNGMAIAIAWPEFVGKQTGAWYDTPMRWLGINKNFHYKVGHAALILVSRLTGQCAYYDCGRYHAPFQCGRIRDAATDVNLTIRTKARISGEQINNFNEILQEIQENKTCFGVGKLYAAYCPVNIEAAQLKVKSMQSKGAVLFGPFILKGTNCCRFVRTGILAGKPAIKYRLLLRYAWLLKPMPISNVNCLSHKTVIPEINANRANGQASKHAHSPTAIYTKENVRSTLPAPVKPETIPADSQWLSGEVAGSWFSLVPAEKAYRITRYSAQGAMECTGMFRLAGNSFFNPQNTYRFTHLSHCAKVTILQDETVVAFERVEELQVAKES